MQMRARMIQCIYRCLAPACPVPSSHPNCINDSLISSSSASSSISPRFSPRPS